MESNKLHGICTSVGLLPILHPGGSIKEGRVFHERKKCTKIILDPSNGIPFHESVLAKDRLFFENAPFFRVKNQWGESITDLVFEQENQLVILPHFVGTAFYLFRTTSLAHILLQGKIKQEKDLDVFRCPDKSNWDGSIYEIALKSEFDKHDLAVIARLATSSDALASLQTMLRRIQLARKERHYIVPEFTFPFLDKTLLKVIGNQFQTDHGKPAYIINQIFCCSHSFPFTSVRQIEYQSDDSDETNMDSERFSYGKSDTSVESLITTKPQNITKRTRIFSGVRSRFSAFVVDTPKIEKTNKYRYRFPKINSKLKTDEYSLDFHGRKNQGVSGSKFVLDEDNIDQTQEREVQPLTDSIEVFSVATAALNQLNESLVEEFLFSWGEIIINGKNSKNHSGFPDQSGLYSTTNTNKVRFQRAVFVAEIQYVNNGNHFAYLVEVFRTTRAFRALILVSDKRIVNPQRVLNPYLRNFSIHGKWFVPPDKNSVYAILHSKNHYAKILARVLKLPFQSNSDAQSNAETNQSGIA